LVDKGIKLVLFDVYKALDQVSGDAVTTNPSSIRPYRWVWFCGISFHYVWAELMSLPSVWSTHQGPIGYEMRLLKTRDRSRLVLKKSKHKIQKRCNFIPYGGLFPSHLHC